MPEKYLAPSPLAPGDATRADVREPAALVPMLGPGDSARAIPRETEAAALVPPLGPGDSARVTPLEDEAAALVAPLGPGDSARAIPRQPAPLVPMLGPGDGPEATEIVLAPAAYGPGDLQVPRPVIRRPVKKTIGRLVSEVAANTVKLQHAVEQIESVVEPEAEGPSGGERSGRSRRIRPVEEE